MLMLGMTASGDQDNRRDKEVKSAKGSRFEFRLGSTRPEPSRMSGSRWSSPISAHSRLFILDYPKQ